MKITLDDQSDSQFLNEMAGNELALDKSKAKAESNAQAGACNQQR